MKQVLVGWLVGVSREREREQGFGDGEVADIYNRKRDRGAGERERVKPNLLPRRMDLLGDLAGNQC